MERLTGRINGVVVYIGTKIRLWSDKSLATSDLRASVR